jgi:hypothetical protein
MNEHTPLSPEAVDALLSADLDGDIEAAARDLGLSASEARAQLAATPGVAQRRVALTRARDLVASRPQLEASVEDNLVAAAMAPDEMAIARARRRRNERRWRVLVGAGSVAAAVAVIVGISSMDNHTSSNAKSAAVLAPTTQRDNGESSSPAHKAVDESRPDFGNVSSPAALRAPAQRLLAQRAKSAKVVETTQPPGKVAAPYTFDTTGVSQDRNATSFAAAAAPACTTERLRRYDITARPALIARGTVAGAPVMILIYDGSGHPYAYVIRVGDCSLVRKQSLG